MTLRRAAPVGLAVALGVAALYPLHAWLERREAARAAWKAADADADGLGLFDDRDADGDGLDALLDADADGDGIPNAADAVAAGRALMGRGTDPLMGQYDNLLGRIGLVVCTDVVIDAWLAAGVSLPRLLRDAAATGAVATAADNLPGDVAFVRRVRNYADLFEHTGVLADVPHPGDVAFYGRSHVALVVEVPAVGYRVVEAYGARVTTRSGREVEARTGAGARFGRVGVN